MLKNKVIYLLLAAYSVVFAILYTRYISALIMLVVLCLPIVLFLLFLFILPFISIEIIPSTEHIGREEDVKICLHMINKSIFPITYCKLVLSYGNEYAKKMTKERIKAYIDAKSEMTAECHITAEHCGKITVCCESIYIYDYFKIFSVRKKVRKQVTVTVLPQLFEIEQEFWPNQFCNYADSDQYSKRKAGDDPSEVFNIREYKEGDKLHRIHWKLSSKKNQFMIKEFSLPINCSIGILADFTVDKNSKKMYDEIDALQETIVSISNFLLSAGYIHDVIWYDYDQQEIHRERIMDWEELCLFMETLAGIGINRGSSLLLDRYSEELGTEMMADMFYIGETFTEEKRIRMNNNNSCLWHVLCINDKREMEEESNVTFLQINIENVEESFKEEVF
jgi:Uncharacterized conserved protein (some members contain a von Willebrand factor type A (vWA) domain)